MLNFFSTNGSDSLPHTLHNSESGIMKSSELIYYAFHPHQLRAMIQWLVTSAWTPPGPLM